MALEYRLRECIEMNRTWLDLSNLGLESLTCVIPENVKYFDCSHNKLKKLECIFPSKLVTLNCSNNQLESLPDKLPDTLESLYCQDNRLKIISNLPRSFQALYCQRNCIIKLTILSEDLICLHVYKNKLTRLPVMPSSMQMLDCDDNDYLYIPRDVVKRFNLKETPPDYHHAMQSLKTIYSSQKRRKKLVMCSKLEDQYDEFQYRPLAGGYVDLINKYKRRFADLL